MKPLLFCRSIGHKEFWCPKCKSFNRHRLTPKTYTVVCQNNRCHTTFVVYDGLLECPRGLHTPPPPDRIAPLFASVHPDKWRAGQPANIFIPASEAPPGLFDDPEEEKA